MKGEKQMDRMEEINRIEDASDATGFWYGERVLCPWCYQREGGVLHDEIISPDDRMALLFSCAICKITLGQFQEMEKAILNK